MLKLIAFHRWIEGDALDLPFPNGCFDAITMGYGLRNVVDKEKAMQELLRVVKSGISYSSVHPQNRNLQTSDSEIYWGKNLILFFFSVSGSRVSVLDFNKSTSPLSSSFQVYSYTKISRSTLVYQENAILSRKYLWHCVT